MDKKKKLLILVPIVATVLIMISLFILIFCLHFDKNYTTVTIDSKQCQLLFDVSPQEFCQSKGRGTQIENGYTYAMVDRDGYLKLILSEKQISNWKNQLFALQVMQLVLGDEKDIGVDVTIKEDDLVVGTYVTYADKCGLTVSDDFKKIIGEPIVQPLFVLSLMQACIYLQLLDGIPSDEIHVEYYQYNETGEIIDQLIWPDDAKNN